MDDAVTVKVQAHTWMVGSLFVHNKPVGLIKSHYYLRATRLKLAKQDLVQVLGRLLAQVVIQWPIALKIGEIV